MKARELLERAVRDIIKIIFICIIGYLTIVSVKETCSVNLKETTFYNSDSIVKNVFAIATVCVLCALLTIMRKNLSTSKKHVMLKIIRKSVIIIAVCWTVFSIAWVLSTQLKPRADQKYVMDAAKNIAEHNYIDFEKGQYLNIYPDQAGIVMIFYFLGIILGKYNYVAIQLINVFAVLISYFYIYKICNKMFSKNTKTELYLVLISLFAYVQFAFYTTFVYGNLIGLMFSVMGIYYELKFFENNKIINIIISFLCISLAIIVKANYLITLVAMFGILVYKAIFEKKYKYLILALILLICYMGCAKVVEFSVKKVTGQEKLSGGVPKLAWIEMGLQEGGFASGWYNSYNRKVYLANDCNTEATNKAVKQDFKDTIDYYKIHPNELTNYMNNKVKSQWNNPTFQCFWVNQNRKSNVEMPKWAESIINEKGAYPKLTIYMDIMQTVILFGTLCYVIFNFKNIEMLELFFAIVFIGGFLFHIIWEAKCQYTVTYFILLIPYSVKGYFKLSQFMQGGKKNKV